MCDHLSQTRKNFEVPFKLQRAWGLLKSAIGPTYQNNFSLCSMLLLFTFMSADTKDTP